MKKIFQPLTTTLIVFLIYSCQTEVNYDYVIKNGRVMDPETGFDKVTNIGILNGKIVKISDKTLKGQNTIDAAGLIVAPGFIDGHSHIVDNPLGQQIMARDGVTTAMDLEAGAINVNQWYKFMKGKSLLNYGISVGTLGSRVTTFDTNYSSVHGGGSSDIALGHVHSHDYVDRVATREELNAINSHLQKGLNEGALGIGSVMGYMVEGFSSEEIINPQKLAAEHGVFVHAHTRFSGQMPPTPGFLAFEEVMSPMSTYGGGLIIAHFTAQALDQTAMTLDFAKTLQAKGQSINLEVYPYNFGGAGNGIQADYLKPENLQRNMGRTYSDIIDGATGERINKEMYDSLVLNDPYHPVYYYHVSEEDMLLAVKDSSTLIGCDCYALSDSTGADLTDIYAPLDKVHTHPRTAGTHSKVLKFSRQYDDFPLMWALAKMSYQWALFLENNGIQQMKYKGRIQEGMDADIVIFNINTVKDNSEIAIGKNAASPSGIHWVIVNGSVIVHDNKIVKSVAPGKAIRRNTHL